MNRQLFVIYALLIFILILLVIRSIVDTQTVDQGMILYQLRKQLANQDTQNMILEEKVLTITSYTYIASKAASMGFIEAGK